jgi:acyl-CoA thioester hydrolase
MRDEDAQRRKLLITVRLPVRWSDQDVNGHVNNAMHFTYFEQTRIEWLKNQSAVTDARGQGVVVARASCDYIRPIPYPETLEIRMHAGPIGRSSFPTSYEMFGADGSTRYAEGHAVLVWVDRAAGKSQPLPDALRAVLE